MQAADCRPAVVFGISEGGPMSALFAATHPDLVSSLVLYGTYARVLASPDHPVRGYRSRHSMTFSRW